MKIMLAFTHKFVVRNKITNTFGQHTKQCLALYCYLRLLNKGLVLVNVGRSHEIILTTENSSKNTGATDV